MSAKRALLIAFACLSACEENATPAAPDAAVPAGPVRIYDAAPLPDAEPVVCAQGACPAVSPGPLLVQSCCLDGGACGLRTPYAGEACLAPEQPGHPDLTCPPLAIPGGPLLQGCCGPSGTCGVYDRFGALGCVASETLGRPPVACDYGADTECRQIAEVYCDGPEDCASGLECCGRLGADAYDAFGCFPDCRTVVDGVSGVWVPLCHVGEPCAQQGHQCTSAPELPETYARCYPGLEEDLPDVIAPVEPGIRCGESSCAVGQKCCLRPPHAPYCAPALMPCACAELNEPATDASVSPDGAF